MIDFSKYNFDHEDIEFLLQTEDWCINCQSEIVLEYKGYSFCIEPSGKEVQIVDKSGVIGEFASFDDMLLNYKIDGKPLIELVKELEYGD